MSIAGAQGEVRGAGLVVMTESELASMRREEGVKVVQRAGHHWGAIFPGFYQPIHLLTPMSAAEIRRPTALCWGYRAALRAEDASLANGSIPVHLLPDAHRFSESMLDESRRRDLRRCRREVEIRRLLDPGLIVEQGYEVFMSAQRRVDFYWPHMTEDEYRRRMATRVLDQRRLFVVGLVDGRLGGYLESYAVDDTLYANELFVATEAMRTGIGTGLYVETIETGASAAAIHHVSLGLHTPERQGITWFKEGLGFPIVNVPARTMIPRPLGAYIRSRRPAAHYRLTGLGVAEAPKPEHRP